MKLDRLLGILTVLLQTDRTTAPKLAEKFEVTRRTIGRDIDTLCMAGIPVITHQGAGGGISIADGFKLDKSVLTQNELSDIVAAIKGIGSVSDKTNIERTLDKLHANTDTVVSMREPVIIDLASYYKGQLTEKIELIKRAVHESRLVEFDYYYEKGLTHRKIEPYFVIFQWNSWYLFGYCLKRKDWRLFKLLRLWDFKIADKTYAPREIPPERRNFLENTDNENNNRLVAIFDPSVKYRLIEAYGMDCFTETDAGLRFELDFAARDFMTSWLLGFGGRVKVLEPADIIEELQSAAKNIMKQYK